MHKFHMRPCVAGFITGIVCLMLFLLLQPAGIVLGSSHAVNRSAVVTITGKTSDAVMVSERSFVVTDATVFHDENGDTITLDDLAVPCTAQMRYQLRMDKSPLCLKIAVKKKMKGATKYWSSSDKEGSK